MNEAIDEALERLRGMGMEMVGGMPNHGPMASGSARRTRAWRPGG